MVDKSLTKYKEKYDNKINQIRKLQKIKNTKTVIEKLYYGDFITPKQYYTILGYLEFVK